MKDRRFPKETLKFELRGMRGGEKDGEVLTGESLNLDRSL
jgi:hypothetical protein